MAAFFGSDTVARGVESGQQLERLRAFVNAAKQGRLGQPVATAPFYVLGLSPNASRLFVRVWLSGTVAQFVDRLLRHLGDLQMVGERPAEPPLSIRRLLLETAREPKDVPPKLGGDVARAVLTGNPYPQPLFTAVIRRIRADAAVNHRRAAILKAFLIRNRHWEVPVALNKDHPREAYHLGRLFGALEKTQEDASGGNLNSTIKDRYFGAASATPGSIFPILLRLHPHHMDKIENVGLRVNREKLVTEICSHLSAFPTHLSLEHQGLFHIGYYHQRQDFFTKRAEEPREVANG